ncbi:50S ribosomal protein L30 [bacterium]|nr:50S ribosomal protein L30 [bacterium]
MSAAKKKVNQVRITWVKSAIRRTERQVRIIEALGLRKLNQSVVHNDSPTIRGMINKVPHLIKVESVEA